MCGRQHTAECTLHTESAPANAPASELASAPVNFILYIEKCTHPKFV